MNQLRILSVLLSSLLSWNGLEAQASSPAEDRSDQPLAQARAAENKQTILTRLEREEVSYRGQKPGQIRIRWEWYDKVFNNYLYEKTALLRELSANEKYALRARWAYKDMKLTFQELFDLGPEDDDKLLPILSHEGLIAMAPSATFEGLTLLGKHAEVKGIVVRKYKERVSSLLGGLFIGRLEYENDKGKLVTAKTGGSRLFQLIRPIRPLGEIFARPPLRLCPAGRPGSTR